MLRIWVVAVMALFACNINIVHANEGENCICELLERPDMLLKEKRARWMVHSLEFGVLSTISTRFPDGNTPFGNIYSFVDGPCDSSTGIPYFYSTALDQTNIDIQSNPKASFSLTEASLPSVCSVKHGLKSCSTLGKYGDPENPMCARLTLTGTLVEVPADSDEFKTAQSALFQRHPSMVTWPANHKWIILKLIIDDIWFIDYFGGATIMSVDQYYSTELMSSITEEAH
jgi:hypothetical protein